MWWDPHPLWWPSSKICRKQIISNLSEKCSYFGSKYLPNFLSRNWFWPISGFEPFTKTAFNWFVSFTVEKKIHPPPFQLLLVVVKDARLPSHVAMNTRPPRSGWNRLGSREIGWEDTVTVDGNQKSGINSPVEGKVVDIPLFTTGLENIQTVVGFGISGCHPQYVGLSGFYQLMVWVGGLGPGGCNKTSIRTYVVGGLEIRLNHHLLDVKRSKTL